jgi:hypothetical protein
MTLLLFRLYTTQRYEGEGEDAELVEVPEVSLLGQFPDEGSVRARIKQEGGAGVTHVPGPGGVNTVEPQDRFAVYESTRDTDADGFPDGFTFSELLTASPPESQDATVRKGKRRG